MMRTRTRGFTLIELMVSIALFGLIASGAMMLVMSGLRLQSHSARVDVAQSAVRAGLDFMTRDLLSASAGATTASIMIAGTATPTIAVSNNTGINGSDVLDLYMADSNYDFSTVYNAVATSATSLTVDQTSQFSVGQLAILTDLNNAVRVTIGAIAAASGSPQRGTLTVSGLGAMPVSGYSAGAFVFVFKHVQYKIGQPFGAATSTSTTTYANQDFLMMDMFDGANGASNPQPLAEGVEDLQVALGFDTTGDGAITDTSSSSDEWIYNASGDALPATLANLKAVRITIIAKSTLNENVAGNTQVRPAVEDHAQGATADGFFRRIIRSEVSVRNLNI